LVATSRFFLFLECAFHPFDVCDFRDFDELSLPSELGISGTFEIFFLFFNAGAKFDHLIVLQEATRSLSFKESVGGDACDLPLAKIKRLTRRVQVIIEVATSRIFARNCVVSVANAFVDTLVGDSRFRSDSESGAAWE